LRNADRLSLFQIAAEMEPLAERARTGKASRDELTGSTFTISSLGKLGGVLATPIINFPEVAILGVHKIKETPVVRDGQIVIRSVMNLSISLDHRIVDGYEGALFMQHVVGAARRSDADVHGAGVVHARHSALCDGGGTGD
jgi:pyruvate/2-oxoglutarate dehydrogenase complex dihydrolipoamide acyltransferase (E2) component